VLGQTALIIPGAANTGNFSDGARISISAFTDSLGQLFVTSAQIDDSAAKQDILLHGEISAVNSVSGTFSVAGIPFNAASADSLRIKTVDGVITLIEAGLCLAQSDLPLFPCANTDTTEFLNGLAPGSYVEISNAWYDGALLQGGEVLLR
jgi:hypothetical protein